MKKHLTTLVAIALLCCFNFGWVAAQSVCGFDGGQVDAPGPVGAGTVVIPAGAPTDGTILVDGSDAATFEQVPGQTADNGGIAPDDALLPAPQPDPGGGADDLSSDYEYIAQICPAGVDTCFLLSSLNGVFNPADLAGDGSIPAMPVGSTISVSGFAYSLGQVNAILQFVANPFVCGLIEDTLPEGVTCADVAALAEQGIESVNDLLILTGFFGFVAESVPDALVALGTIENLLIDNNFVNLTPCYAVTGWSDASVTSASIIAALPAETSAEDQAAAIAAAWNGYDYVLTVSEPAPACDGGTVALDSGETAVSLCTSDADGNLLNFTSTNEAGEDLSYTYVITDADGATILGNPGASNDFSGVPAGVCRVYGVSYEGDLTLGEAGIDGVTASGCISISSNWIEVTRTQVTAATISTTDNTTICLGQGQTVTVSAEGSVGSNMAYVVTTGDGVTILGGPTDNPTFGFDEAPVGQCAIWAVTYEDIDIPTDQVADITGCFALSNAIIVDRLADDNPDCVTVLGCMNADACNFDPAAEEDDGSCFFVADACDDNNAETENDTVQADCSCAGTPIVVVVPGCINADACNFDPTANEDDGSCYFAGDACDDGNAATDNDVWGADCVCAGEATLDCASIILVSEDCNDETGEQTNVYSISGTTGNYTVSGDFNDSGLTGGDTFTVVYADGDAISVTITDGDCSDTFTGDVTCTKIDECPAIELLSEDCNDQTGEQTNTYTISGTAGPYTVSGDYNDTDVFGGDQFTVLYSDGATISITVTDGAECTDTYEGTVTCTKVDGCPAVELVSEDCNDETGEQTNTYSISGEGGPYTVSGDYNESGVMGGDQFTVLYSDGATISITVSDGAECTDTYEGTVTCTKVDGCPTIELVSEDCNDQTGEQTNTYAITGEGGPYTVSGDYNDSGVNGGDQFTVLYSDGASISVTVSDGADCTDTYTGEVTCTKVDGCPGIELTSADCNDETGEQTNTYTITGAGGPYTVSGDYNDSGVSAGDTFTIVYVDGDVPSLNISDGADCSIDFVGDQVTCTKVEGCPPITVDEDRDCDEETGVETITFQINGGNAAESGGNYFVTGVYNGDVAPGEIFSVQLEEGSQVGLFITDSDGACTFDFNSDPVTCTKAECDDIAVSASYDCNGGGLTVSASGGAGTYTFNYQNGEQLADGTYDIVAFDQEGCTGSVMGFTVNCGGDDLGSIGDTVWFDTDGDGVQDPGEEGIANVAVTLTYPDGTTVTVLTDENGNYLFDDLPAGSYTVTVGTGPDGTVLTTSGSVSVTLGAGEDYVDADFGFTATTVCDLSATASYACSPVEGLIVTPVGGSGDYSYSIAPGTVLTPGVYTVTVTDNADGCAVNVSVEATDCVVDCDPITVTAAYDCNGGGFSVSASGGTGSYTYNYTAGSTLVNGTYVVVATDSDGCTGSTQLVVDCDTPVCDPITVTASYDCNGGGLIISAAGGTGSYTFSSAPGTQLANGTYVMVATDGDGCTGSTQLLVNCASGCGTAITVVESIDCDDEEGVATGTFYILGGGATAQGGTFQVSGDYNGTVSPGETFTIGGLVDQDVVNLVITDVPGCPGLTWNSSQVSCVKDCSVDGTYSAGTMSDFTLLDCATNTVVGTFNNDAIFPANSGDFTFDLIYVLHTGSSTPNTLGTIVAINASSPTFTFAQGMQYNTTYYISPVMTPLNINGDPDLNSQCTVVGGSISGGSGQPVSWLAPITVTIDQDCDETTGEITVTVAVFGGLAEAEGGTYQVTGDASFTAIPENGFTYGVYQEGDIINILVTDDGGFCAVNQEFSQEAVACIKPNAVEMLTFMGSVEDEGNLINWVTGSETNSNLFLLERSTDAVNFEQIATIEAQGFSTGATAYDFMDKDAAAGLSYYRLVEVDADGVEEIATQVISLERGEVTFGITSVSPMPIVDLVNIAFNSVSNSEVTVELFNVTGQLLQSNTMEANIGENVMELNLDAYSTGIYFISLSDGVDVMTSKVIIE